MLPQTNSEQQNVQAGIHSINAVSRRHQCTRSEFVSLNVN